MGRVSDKATCPACGSHTSGVMDALIGRRDSCPSCGLAGSVMREVESARKAWGDADLAGRLETALVRAGKAESELKRLRARLRGIRQTFAEWEREDPVSAPGWDYAEMDWQPDD